MISSHRIVRRKRPIPLVMNMIKPYYDEIWQVYYKIFNETSNKQRSRFFGELLIKVLWSKFIVDKASEIFQYLQSVRNDYQYSPQVYESFLKDIRTTEINFNFRILP